MVFLFISCEKDEISNSENGTQNENYSVSIIDGKFIKKNDFVSEKLLFLQNQNIGSKGGDTLRLVVDTTYVKYVVNADRTYHSYTFKIVNPSKGTYQNLLFSWKGNGYSTFLVTYELSAQQAQMVLVGKQINLAPYVEAVEVSIHSDGMEVMGKVSCSWVVTWNPGDSCGSGEHQYGEPGCTLGSDEQATPGHYTVSLECTGSSASGYYNGGIPGSGNTNQDDPTYYNGGGSNHNGEDVTSPVLCHYCPEFDPVFSNFVNDHLNPEQQDWLWNHQNYAQYVNIKNFLQDNVYSPESIAFAEEAIAALMDDGDQVLIKEVLDAYTNNTTIVDSPEDPIIDIADYLDCFNTSQGATVTLYADRPDPNDPSDYMDIFEEGPGHAFVSIDQGNKTASYGFYPETGVGYPNPTTGTMGNDADYSYDVSVTISVDAQTLQTLFTHSISFSQTDYDLRETNCTDFAISAGNIIGFTIPESQCTGSFVIGEGATPGMFGDYLRNMTLPPGATRDNNGGNSPSNQNCP